MNKLSNVTDIMDLTGDELNEIYNCIDNSTKQQTVKNDTCPHCLKKDTIVEDKSMGIMVCNECGQVVCSSLMDHGPEWRNYDDGDDSGRCGMSFNALLPQSSLGTTIGGYRNSRIKIIHKWNAMPYKERSLNEVLNEIKDKCQKAGILGCIENDAKILYKTVSECKHLTGKSKGKYVIIRGTNRKGLIAACVYFACRKIGKTRSAKEIAEIFGIKHTGLNKGCKHLAKLIKNLKFDYNTTASQPEHYIVRFCDELRVLRNYTTIAIKIAKNIQKLNIASSHTPLSMATGSILLMADICGLKNLTKRRIATKFNISEVTVVKAYNKIVPYKHILNDDVKVDNLLKKMDEMISNDDIPLNLRNKLQKLKQSPQCRSISSFNVEFMKKLIDIEKKYNDILDNKYNNIVKHMFK